MADRLTTPRLAPLAADEQSEDQRQLLASAGAGPGADPINIFTTLVRHPGLFRRWLPFGGKLLQGSKLPSRDRELVILRVAWRCRAAYEWAQHVGIGRQAGLSADEIRRIAGGPDAEGWSDEDAALLRAVDELHDDSCITDATWAALAARYDEKQMIETTMLAGHYSLLAGTLNSLGVQPEGPLPALGEA
jgi:4-carboxymuconolactone decarboxylase